MMNDFQLSRDFWLHEWPCWWKATPSDVAKLQETTARVLQPIRNRFGPVYPSSWMWWRDGCTPRTGSHAQGGTVDFKVSNGRTYEAWQWGHTHLMPAGYIGRWIYEPETETQGEHIHCAPRADMIAYNGDGTIKALLEQPDGSYWLSQAWEGGTFVNPYELEPIVVTARAGFPLWLGAALLFLVVSFDMSSQAAGGWQIRR